MIPLVATVLLSSQIYTATLVRVIDGDTFIARIDGESVRIRLRVVDAPELRGRCPRERELALAAKGALAKLLPAGSSVTLHKISTEWRGRRTALVRIPDGRDPAAEIVAQGHAKPWINGAKARWCETAPDWARKLE